jgi:hypothetical protein
VGAEVDLGSHNKNHVVDDYDTMRETIAVLSDSALLLAHEVGVREFAADDILDTDYLAHAMKNVGLGRSVDTKWK